VPGERARRALAGSRFGDVRWVAETGSTNADALALARAGEPEGIVVVADHQTAGRGRRGRTWTAPPGGSLLVSIVMRPPASAAAWCPMAVAVAAAAAVEATAGFAPRLKWPNDLVWPGDGTEDDRKLAGILAEADWPARSPVSGGWSEPPPGERVTVVVGIGLNVAWAGSAPPELVDAAVAIDGVTDRAVDREELLAAMLSGLDRWYGDPAVVQECRRRSATLGRRVRVDLGGEMVEGRAVEVTSEGHLVVETGHGDRRTIAVGDVVHLRPA
jgi:BirA family transcriptional regulator, biotin operon repressor / biotin---[acetyl-CoA-carboxylase] ligase